MATHFQVSSFRSMEHEQKCFCQGGFEKAPAFASFNLVVYVTGKSVLSLQFCIKFIYVLSSTMKAKFHNHSVFESSVRSQFFHAKNMFLFRVQKTLTVHYHG
jgi:hypothetical protein